MKPTVTSPGRGARTAAGRMRRGAAAGGPGAKPASGSGTSAAEVSPGRAPAAGAQHWPLGCRQK